MKPGKELDMAVMKAMGWDFLKRFPDAHADNYPDVSTNLSHAMNITWPWLWAHCDEIHLKKCRYLKKPGTYVVIHLWVKNERVVGLNIEEMETEAQAIALGVLGVARLKERG